eukprot:TRINITY_DN1600_c0_g1_i4.p1 TRINITY_DN1600_c0_g1~~TRINITY_DN1600_c0_g1_i4.p1  ORF type:complete len:152 (+),score=19.28 TRINITY_DN1600_c0_g1_i4:299-754(+)
MNTDYSWTSSGICPSKSQLVLRKHHTDWLSSAVHAFSCPQISLLIADSKRGLFSIVAPANSHQNQQTLPSQRPSDIVLPKCCLRLNFLIVETEGDEAEHSKGHAFVRLLVKLLLPLVPLHISTSSGSLRQAMSAREPFLWLITSRPRRDKG